MSTTAIVLDGLLRSDGTLVFDAPPRFPPGRVRITLQRFEDGRAGKERLPDPPSMDESISAPCDLPRPSGERVEPRVVQERLPDRLEGLQDDAS